MNSILAQSYTDWELISIDDHSTDTSPEIIRGYSHGDSRIKCLNTPGVGIADALNFGVEKANSGIIARMDSDDLMRSTRLEEQLIAPIAGARDNHAVRDARRGLTAGERTT